MFFKKKNKKNAAENTTQCPRFSDSIENYTVETFKSSSVRIGKVHAVGKRENQQDAFAYSDVANENIVREKGMLLLVADGMGGMENGAAVSSTVALEALRYFDAHKPGSNIPKYMNDMVQYINDKVNSFLGSKGIGRSGSTLVAMHIKDHAAHWISVGDSCIYLHQKSKFVKLNKMHNYRTQLEEKLQQGKITLEQFNAEPNKQALTSYIGAGDIALIDQNFEPLVLGSGDRVMLMSDGVETVSEQELYDVLRYDVEEAALKLRYLIEQKNKKNQDNFTAIIAEDNY